MPRSSEVICQFCGAVGEVHVLGIVGKDASIRDFIDHGEGCKLHLSRAPKGQQPRHLKKKAWQKQERRAASVVGAGLTPASGAVGEDGDARSFHNTRLECKQSETGRFNLDQRVWAKLVRGALSAGEIPVLQVTLTRIGIPIRYYVIAEGHLEVPEVRSISQSGARTRVSLTSDSMSDCPFVVPDILVPNPLILTEHQFKEALNGLSE